ERDTNAARREYLVRPGASRDDDGLRGQRSALGVDSAHTAALPPDAGHWRLREQDRPGRRRGDGQADGNLGRLKVDVSRDVHCGQKPVRLNEWIEAPDLGGLDERRAEAVAPTALDVGLQDRDVLGRPRELQAPRPDDPKGLAGRRLE